MAIRTILTVPDPVLKQVSKPVDAVTDETRRLMDDMLETMYAAPDWPRRGQIARSAARHRDGPRAECEPNPPLYFLNPGDPRTLRENSLRGVLPLRPTIFDEFYVPSAELRYLDSTSDRGMGRGHVCRLHASTRWTPR